MTAKYDFPRIDLHLHLDGSVRPATVLELAREQGLPLGEKSLDEVDALMRDQDTTQLNFDAFDTPLLVMQTPEALARITAELLDTLAAGRVIYGEIRFAPQFHCRRGMTQREAVEAVLAGVRLGRERNPGISAGVILCAMAFGPAADTWAQNQETARLCKEYLGRGVVALDLAGYEDRLPEFAPVFQMARELGLPSTCHAEEFVADAIPFGTRRIGHGYQTAWREDLIQYMLERRITLEMCPKSSFTYCTDRDRRHPLRVLFERGVRVTVNTDNMTVLDTDLDQEYGLCEAMGFTPREILQMNITAARAAFQPPEERRRLEAALSPFLTRL